MANNIHCIAAELHNHSGVHLIRCEQDSLKRWYYMLISPAKAQIFNGLVNFFPLSIPLFDYGIVLHEGIGEAPPPALAQKISIGDFSDTSSTDSEVFCLISESAQGREFFTYLIVPFYLIAQFKSCYDMGGEIEFTDFGDILLSDWGRPSKEIIEKMNLEYNIQTPAFAEV